MGGHHQICPRRQVHAELPALGQAETQESAFLSKFNELKIRSDDLASWERKQRGETVSESKISASTLFSPPHFSFVLIVQTHLPEIRFKNIHSCLIV
jgi:hypothetical protein